MDRVFLIVLSKEIKTNRSQIFRWAFWSEDEGRVNIWYTPRPKTKSLLH